MGYNFSRWACSDANYAGIHSARSPANARKVLDKEPLATSAVAASMSCARLLQQGPVHIIRNNLPAYVVLSQEQFTRLTEARGDALEAPLVHRPVGRTFLMLWPRGKAACGSFLERLASQTPPDTQIG